MKYYSDELDRGKFSDLAYCIHCTVHSLNELLTLETNHKYIIVEKQMLCELYHSASKVTQSKWRDKAQYLALF